MNGGEDRAPDPVRSDREQKRFQLWNKLFANFQRRVDPINRLEIPCRRALQFSTLRADCGAFIACPGENGRPQGNGVVAVVRDLLQYEVRHVFAENPKPLTNHKRPKMSQIFTTEGIWSETHDSTAPLCIHELIARTALQSSDSLPQPTPASPESFRSHHFRV